MSAKWEKVGKIAVDSGSCWIGDPCYVMHHEPPPPDIGTTWAELSARLLQREKMRPFGVAQFTRDGPHGFTGLGVNVSTGYGDGIYNVEVRRDDGRIAEVRVVFIPEREDQ